MKKYVLLLAYLMFTVLSIAQNTVISLDKMNVLYMGIDNPIELAADKYDCKDLKILTSNMTVKCDDTCKCIARVTTQGKASLIILNKENKPIDTVDFRVRMISDPQVVVVNQAGGRVDCSQVFEWKALVIQQKNFDFDARFEILSFSVYYDEKGGWPYYIRNQGSEFGRDLKIIMNKIKPGDIIYFEDISVRGPDNLVRKMPGIAFKIEE